MNLTYSYEHALPEEIRARYEIRETRNASTIFRATNPELFLELIAALNNFEVLSTDLLLAGGQESTLARRFNESFRSRGWREARVDTDIELKLRIMPYRNAGETEVQVSSTPVSNDLTHDA